MYKKELFLVFFVILFSSIFAQDIPVFDEPIILECTNGNLIMPLDDTNPAFSVLTIVDWNGDGTTDIIMGTFAYGFIDFFPNSGTNENPQFIEAEAEHMQAGGVDINLSGG